MRRRYEFAGLTLLLLGALAVRAFVSLRAFHGSFDSLTVGVMACDIQQGARPLFFYGQNYMGALEAYVAAGFFSLFGRSLFTLSLAPICFSLLWLGASWLLVRELYGSRPALATVAVLAVPGWYALWFNLSSHGGYPGCFFFGTLATWLAACLWTRRPSGAGLVLPILSIGLAAGLAIWTNFLAASWLVFAAVACLGYAVRCRRDPWLWGSALGGVALLGLGALPVLATLHGYSDASVAAWTWHEGLFTLRVSDFLRPGLGALAFSQEEMPRAWKLAVQAALAAGALQYGCLLLMAGGWKRRSLLVLPVAFLIVFLVLAMPHHLAATRAFRYLLPFWSALCVALFALPVGIDKVWPRRVALGVLLFWIALQGSACLVLASHYAPRKQAAIAARDRIDRASAELGHPPILVAGDRVLGYRTMNNNFWSGGRSQFASAFDDRNRRVAEAVEAAPQHLLATSPTYRDRLENTLRDLEVKFRTTDAGALILYETDAPAARAGASLYPLSAQQIRSQEGAVPADALVDRRWETEGTAVFAPGDGVLVRLPAEAALDSLVLVSTHPYQDLLPARFRVVARNAAGATVLTKDIGPRFTSGYVEDGRVFLKGYFGVLETSLGGVTADALWIEPLAGFGAGGQCSISEIFVFPRTDSPLPTAAQAWPVLRDAIRAGDAGFVMAPRVVSAWLNAERAEGTETRAFPRYNPRFADTLGSRFFVPGMTLVISQKYADECVRLFGGLYGDAIVSERRTAGPWQVLRTRRDTPAVRPERLVWTGHTLLQTAGPEPIWHLP